MNENIFEIGKSESEFQIWK